MTQIDDAQKGVRDVEFPVRLRRIVDDITLPPNFQVRVRRDEVVPDGRWYFQLEVERPDTFTGCPGVGRSGKAYLSSHATDSELVQTLFGLYKAYVEHEARESFLWRGRRVFGPHIDIEALWSVAEQYALRAAPDPKPPVRELSLQYLFRTPGLPGGKPANWPEPALSASCALRAGLVAAGYLVRESKTHSVCWAESNIPVVDPLDRIVYDVHGHPIGQCVEITLDDVLGVLRARGVSGFGFASEPEGV
jgi:hypothetical protein